MRSQKNHKSTFHIDRPAAALTLECYYPGNQANPPLHLMCSTPIYFRLNLHRDYEQVKAAPMAESTRLRSSCSRSAGSVGESTSLHCHRARPTDSPSWRRILICSRCSVIEADGALRTGPTWLHFSSYLSIHLAIHPYSAGAAAFNMHSSSTFIFLLVFSVLVTSHKVDR